MVNYPTSLDTDGTLWLVADNVDIVEAKHHNALKDAVIALETALGITGAFNFTTDAEFTAHTTSNPNAHHTPTIASDLNHNDLANLNAGDAYEHITQTQKNALHAVVTTLTHTALTGKNDETDIKHLTDAQLGALHAIYALTNDLAAGEITQLQAIGDVTISYAQWGYVGELTASIKTHMDAANPHSSSASDTDLSNHASATATHGKTTIAGMEDLHAQSHNNTYHSTNYEVYNANIQSHVASPPADSHHAKYALLDDLIANEITAIKAIDDASINNAKWDYVAALTEGPQAHMDASNPHSGSAGDGDLHSETHALAITGPHTGELPLADLAAGSSGSLIIRGAADWEELGKADDSYVLTLVSGLPAWQAAGAPGSHSLDSGSHSDIATITETKGMILWWNGTGWAGLTDPAIVGLPIVCTNVDGTIAWGGSTDMNLNAQILIGCGLPNIAGASIQTKKGDGLTTWTFVGSTECKIEYVKCGTSTKAHKTGSVEMEFEAQEAASGHVYFEYSINDGSSWMGIDDMEQTWDQYETWAPTCPATLESTALGDNIWYRFRVTGDLVFSGASDFTVLTHATTWAEFEMVE